MNEKSDLIEDILDRALRVFRGLHDGDIAWAEEAEERFVFRLRDELQFALGSHLEEVNDLRRELCRRVIQEGKAHD